MLYMVIERFKNRDAKAVYRRFREKGRMAPQGLDYVESGVEANFDRCFQLMECGEERLLERRSRSSRRNSELRFFTRMIGPAESGQQCGQFRPVLLAQGREFQS